MQTTTYSTATLSVAQRAALRFTRAVEPFEFDGAFRRLYQSYRQRGMALPHHKQMRLTRYHLLPTTRVFVARNGRQIIGTLSLVEDGPVGIPMRLIFDDAVDDLTRDTTRIAEATCLAVHEGVPQGLDVVHRLMGLAAQAAHRRGVARIVIAVHPRHAPFYVRSAGFRVFANTRPYPTVGGLPAVALQLNVATLHEDNPAVYRRYFGMEFSPIALSGSMVPAYTLRRLTALWHSLHVESPEPTAAVATTARARPRVHRAVPSQPPAALYRLEGLRRQRA